MYKSFADSQRLTKCRCCPVHFIQGVAVRTLIWLCSKDVLCLFGGYLTCILTNKYDRNFADKRLYHPIKEKKSVYAVKWKQYDIKIKSTTFIISFELKKWFAWCDRGIFPKKYNKDTNAAAISSTKTFNLFCWVRLIFYSYSFKFSLLIRFFRNAAFFLISSTL